MSAAQHGVPAFLVGVTALGGLAFAIGRAGWDNKFINGIPARDKQYEVDEAKAEAIKSGQTHAQADKITSLASKGGDHTTYGR